MLTPIAAGSLIPLTVMAFEVRTDPVATPGCAVKLKGSGVVSGPLVVVVLKTPLMPPMSRVLLTVVPPVGDAVCCTQTVWPLLIVPAVVTKLPVQPML